MKLSAATSFCNRTPKQKEPERQDNAQKTAEYLANGGKIKQEAAGPVKYVPIKFTIKPR